MSYWFVACGTVLMSLSALWSTSPSLSEGRDVNGNPYRLAANPEKTQIEGDALTRVNPNIEDGIYLVLRCSQNRQAIGPLASDELFAKNDYHLLEPEERQPTSFMALQKKPFVPLALSGKPELDKDQKGRPSLKLQLARNQACALERFSRKNLGKGIAIVIGGDVVSSHKIKEVIRGGRFQITRCTDDGCRAIYSELVKQ